MPELSCNVQDGPQPIPSSLKVQTDQGPVPTEKNVAGLSNFLDDAAATLSTNNRKLILHVLDVNLVAVAVQHVGGYGYLALSCHSVLFLDSASCADQHVRESYSCYRWYWPGGKGR